MELQVKIITATILFISVIKLSQSRYATSKLTESEYPSYNIIEPDGPGTYAFGYEIDDPASGNKQFRNEERLRNGTVQGSYGLVLPDGTISITKYVADGNGYRSKIENKNPRPLTGSVFDNHKRPSSSVVPIKDASPEISPELASIILSQQKPMVHRPIKPIVPVKMEVKPEPLLPNSMPSLSSQKQIFGIDFSNFFDSQQAPPVIVAKPIDSKPIQVVEPRGITDELRDDSLVEVLYDFQSHKNDDDSEEDSAESSDEDDEDVWEQALEDSDHEVWEDESDYDHIKYVKEVGEWKETDKREHEDDDDDEEEEEEEWVEDSNDHNGKWEEVVEEVEEEGTYEDEWEEFDNDDDDESDENNGDGSEDEDWEEWVEERRK